MSCSIDVNILIYASDESSPFHQTRTLLADRLHLGYVVLLSYLRMVTHPRVMTQPLSSAEGLANIAQLVLGLSLYGRQLLDARYPPQEPAIAGLDGGCAQIGLGKAKSR